MSRIETIMIRSWWVVLFMLLCFMVYEQAEKRRNDEFSKLFQQLKDLEHEKERALQKQKELLLRVNSQSDPAWAELVLMQVLGLTPENQTKVYFK